MKNIKIDPLSFKLGMINCFAEMVACGVKKMAISPPLCPEEHRQIEESVGRVVRGFGIRSRLEKSLMVTALQSAEFTRGKWSILFYEDKQVLRTYQALKKRKKRLEAKGRYNDKNRRRLSRDFMRLLSYPEKKIRTRLSGEKTDDPFLLVD